MADSGNNSANPMDLCEQLAHTTISGGTATSAVSPAISSTGNPLAVTNASAPMLASVGQINPFASGSTESKHEASDAQSSVSSMRRMFGYPNPSIPDSKSSTSALPLNLRGSIVEQNTLPGSSCLSNTKFIVDTGATQCSFVSEAFALKHNLSVHTDGGIQVRLANKSTISPIGTTDPIILTYNDRITSTTLIVLRDLETDFVLGLPECFQLGIVRLLSAGPQQQCGIHAAAQESTAAEQYSYEPSPDVAKKVNDAIGDLLEENSKITGFAKCPPVKLNFKTRQPVYRKQYPLPHSAQKDIDEQIQKWHAKGRIRPSKSPYNLPLTVSPKVDINGVRCGTRVCIDPRAINNLLEDDDYPMPRTREIIDKLAYNSYFSELDLEDAYMQLRLDEQDQDILSFTQKNNRWSFVGSPYGVRTMSAIFQRFIAGILQDLPFVSVYIDNITIASKTLEEHISHLRQVIERLNQYNLKLSIKKLKLAHTALTLLGYHVSRDGVRADPRKVQRVLQWPFPDNVRTLRSFLGVVNYLRSHIRHVSDLCAPLNRARNSEQDFAREMANNEAEMRSSFDRIKEASAHLPVLKWPDFTREFHVGIDASTAGIGAVLYQPTEAQLAAGDTTITAENIISVASRALTPFERNYRVFKLECLAIVFATQEFHDYLFGTHFWVHTDHQALVHLQQHSRRQRTLGSWLTTLLEYDFSIEHIPGKQNILPDCLSRIYAKSGTWGVDTLSHKLADGRLSENVADQSDQSSSDTSPEHVVSIAMLTTESSKTVEREEFMRLLGKTIPSPEERAQILTDAHNAGHFGERALANNIFYSRKLWWPGLHQDIHKIVSTCSACQRWNISRDGLHPLKPIEIAASS